MTELCIDPTRRIEVGEATGIFVRARDMEGHFGSFDIYELDRDSLVAWLRSRGGENKWAENTVLLLLGWDHEALIP